MNRELDNLGQIIDNLPNELKYLGIIKDINSGEFIFFNNIYLDTDFKAELTVIANDIDNKLALTTLFFDWLDTIDDLKILQSLERGIEIKRKGILKNE